MISDKFLIKLAKSSLIRSLMNWITWAMLHAAIA